MERQPRKVTRSYTLSLIVAAAIVAATGLILAWGSLTYVLGHGPVTSDISAAAAPLIVLLALVLLGWNLWHQALEMLRGRKRLQFGGALVVAGTGYLVWSLGGLAVGMGIEETWLSLFSLTLAVVWGIVPVLFSLVFLRRLYSSKGVPRWPWERPGSDHYPEQGRE